ncbi:MAG: glycosyltransferase, partial [Acetobacteraceae bacterium]
IYAAHPEHIAQLESVASTRGHLRIRTLSARPRKLSRRLAALSLLADFRREMPDAVLANTHASALLCAIAARFAPGLAERSALFVRDFQWDDLDFLFERLSPARVLVPNETVAERTGYLFPFHVGPGRRAVTVVPDMVDLPAAAEDDGTGEFLHLATINRFKGHADLMLALHGLKLAGQAVSVRSAGHVADGPLYRNLLALRATLGLEETFAFAGHVGDPAPLLARCRAVVVPSVSHSGGPETFGRAVIEAWAHRKPVVAFAAGGPARLIADGEDGLLVPEGDTRALGEAMARLQHDPQLCQRLGEAGHRKAAKHYEANTVTRQLLGVLGL